jgi:hypothetical protein
MTIINQKQNIEPTLGCMNFSGIALMISFEAFHPVQ